MTASTVITATRHQANVCRSMQTNSDSRVLSLDAWVAETLSAHTNLRLLSDYESSLVWSENLYKDACGITREIEETERATGHSPVIAGDGEAPKRNPGDGSVIARHPVPWRSRELNTSAYTLAHKTCLRWNIGYEALSDARRINPLHLNQFDHYCDKHQCVTIDKALSIINSMLEKDQVTLCSKITLLGFVTPDALLTQLMQHLSQHPKCAFSSRPHTAGRTAVKRFTAADPQAEYEAMVDWALTCSLAIADRQNSRPILCVDPNLAENHLLIERLFMRAKRSLSSVQAAQCSVDIAQPDRLINHPTVSSTLRLLAWLASPLPYADVESLLASPLFIQSPSDHDAVARVIATCRRQQHYHLSLQDAIRLTRGLVSKDAALRKHLDDIAQVSAHLDTPQLPTQWTQQIKSLLEQLDGGLEKFIGCLDTFAKNFPSTPQPYDTVLRELTQLCENTWYANPVEGARIQVLSPDDAVGLPCDALWLCGMTDSQYPKDPTYINGLPLSVQQQNIPFATVNGQSKHALHLIRQLCQQAPDVIVSHAHTNNDMPQSPAPLMQTLFPDAPLYAPNKNPSLRNAQSIDTDDVNTVAWPAGTAVTLSLEALRLQSECPFRAFAATRLQANPLESVRLGLSPALRGQLIHRTLELIYTLLAGDEANHFTGVHQSTLRALSEHDRHNLISRTITQTFQEYRVGLQGTHTIYHDIEQQCLHALLDEYLLKEMDRPPYAVTELESTYDLSIKQHHCRVRLDRVDTLEDGSTAIIDYKTGVTTPVAHWFGDRPLSPQLPAYAVYAKPQATNMAYANIKAGETRYRGLGERGDLLPGTIPLKKVADDASAETWRSLQARWQTALEQLVDEYAEGDIERRPQDASICDNCAYYGLCRVAEEADHA